MKELFSVPRRLAITASGVAAVIALALVLLLGFGPAGAHLMRAAHAEGCPPGYHPADADQGGGGKCFLRGGPERYPDMAIANGELAARSYAPFVSGAPGAYQHAYHESRAIGRAADPGDNQSWKLAGTPPECAAPSTDGSGTCPAPGPDNGNYQGLAGVAGGIGFVTLSGRISAFAFDPATPGHWFASPVVGGVWETSDSGKNWHSIGDGLLTQAVGGIAYDAPLHRVIAGTGDNSFGGDGIAGHGIFYTGDDGATWQTASGIPDLALTFKLVVSPADASGNTVYAATSKGLFRSTDGGASFVNVRLPTSPDGYSPNCAGDTTSSLCFFANDVTDVIVKPTSTSNGPAGAVIAAVGWRAGQKIDTDAAGNPAKGCTLKGAATNCLQAPRNGLYISKTGDPGSFTYITPNGQSPQGLPATPIFGRTALAVAHGAGQSSDAIYALVQDAVKFQGCPDVLDQVPPSGACNSTVTGEGVATVLSGLYASYDFGQTWTKIMDSSQLKQPGTNSSLLGQPGYGPGVQAWYNLWVEADPTATDSSGVPTRVMFGLEEIWENNQTLPKTGGGGVLTSPYPAYPGGTAVTDPWLVVGRYWNACSSVSTGVPCNGVPNPSSPIPGTTTHPDQHAYAMIPDGSGGETLLVGSDGGAYAQHIAKGGDFSNDNWGDGLNATLSPLQPYDAEMAKDGTIVSGLQDNGELKIAPNGHEAEIYGGDAFYTAIDPANSKNIIEEYTYGAASLSNDGGQTWVGITPSSDPTGVTGEGSPCTSSTALFATPIEQDPTQPGHILLGCTQIQETTAGFKLSCGDPSCSTENTPTFTNPFDLSTLPAPNGATNVPSALAVRGANEYVGYCGYCDPATQKVPFANGVATNVGGSKPPKIGSSDGWHKASALCSNCQTANGHLPQRYINSIQEDPSDPNVTYLAMGGYGRRWIPPGSFGEDTTNVGVGHLFISCDHGDHYANITGNLPDAPVNWTAFHNGRLVVATDLGVYIETSVASDGSMTFAPLGTGLPNAPVFTVRANPGNPDELLVSTYGRGDWTYTFPAGASAISGPTCPVASVPPGTGKGGGLGGGGPKGGGFCPKPTGRLSGTSLGRLSLGMTLAQARKLMPHYQLGPFRFVDFCLYRGWGIRVAYPSEKLLRELPRALRQRVAGRIVLALSANRFYSLHGVRPGVHVTPRSKFGKPFRIGANSWYLFPAGAATGVLKVRGGVVQEVGIADKHLTSDQRADRRFLLSFQP